jgi:lipopolysaccharide assembly outer membrane protein LptD (OstA)
VELRCAGSAGPSQEYLVRAPRAQLEFDDGVATFESVHISDRAGGLLTAGRAVYDEKLGTIVAEGPIRYVARGFDVHATAAVVRIDEERVDIAGPITGVYLRPPGTAATPSPPAPPRP